MNQLPTAIRADLSPFAPKASSVQFTTLSPRVAQMHMTRTGLRIGIAHIPKHSYTPSDSQALIQRALLEPPTAFKVSALRRFAGRIWGWL